MNADPAVAYVTWSTSNKGVGLGTYRPGSGWHNLHCEETIFRGDRAQEAQVYEALWTGTAGSRTEAVMVPMSGEQLIDVFGQGGTVRVRACNVDYVLTAEQAGQIALFASWVEGLSGGLFRGYPESEFAPVRDAPAGLR